MHKILSAMLVVFLLGAYSIMITGCGGGGSSGPAVMPEPEPPMASVDLMGLEVEAGEYTIEAGESETVGMGETQVTLSCSAAADCSFTVDEDGMATATSGVVTAMLSEAAMQAIADRKEAERMAAAQEVVDEAERVAKAIGNDAASNLNSAMQLIGDGVVSGGDDTGLAAGDIKVSGGKVTQIDPPINLQADPPVTNEFMMSDTQAGITRWQGSTHTRERTGDMATDMVVVYTDIKENASLPYDEYYTAAGAPDTSVDGEARIAWRGVSAATAEGVLTLTPAVGMAHSLFSADALPSGGNTFVVFEDDEDTASRDERMFEGMFHGISGTFACTGAAGNCRAENNAMGNLAKLEAPAGASWTFTPASSVDIEQARVASVKKDLDYMDFGYWREATDGASGLSYVVSPFVVGSDPIATIPTVRGSATYAGPATGVYMQKRVNDDGSVTPLKSGQFTASTSLTAYFGQTISGDPGVPSGCTGAACGIISPSLVSSINGMVSNFMDSEGNALPSTWSVELMQATLTGLTGGMFEGETTGEGEWHGQFFGPEANAAGDAIQPGSVGGTFDGHFTNGHVAGAFGATKED